MTNLTTDQQVVDFLRRNTSETGVETLKVARELHGAQATRKSVNPLLYRLQKEGKIRKESNEDGTNPRWHVVDQPANDVPVVDTESL